MIAEELRNELDIGSFAAARACTREFKHRGCELAVLDGLLNVNKVSLRGNLLGTVVPFGLFVELGLEGFHLESLHALLAGTYVNTVRAAETVEHVNALDEAHAGEGLADCGDGGVFAEGSGCHFGLVENERTDGGVRADICALVALYAVLLEPFGNESGHTALLIAGCTLLPCAVGDSLEVRHFQQVAVLRVDGAHDAVDEFGIVVGLNLVVGELSPCGINVQTVVFAAAVNGCEVLVNHILTFLAIALDDEFLHLLYGQVNGNNLGDAEERALEDGVGAVAEADFLGNLGGVDIVDGDVVLGEVALYLVGKVLGEFMAFPDGVEQEGAAVAQAAGNIIHVQVSLHVACHEVGGVHQVGRTDGFVAETEVRAGEAARFLRVVCEVSLTILVGVLTDDFHRVLVCAHGAVSAEAVELGLVDACAAKGHFSLRGKRGEGNVVDDADGEVILGHGKGEVLEHADDHRGSGVFRRQAIAAAHDEGGVLLAVESFLNVKVEGFAGGAGFLGAVKHGDALGGGGDGGHQVLHRERTVEVYRNEAHLLALGQHVVDGFLGGLGNGTHGDDDAVGILGAIVVEQVVFTAGDFRNLGHVFLHDFGHGLIVAVAGLAVLEENVAVFSHAAGYGSLGSEGAAAELCQRVAVEKRSQVILLKHLDFLDFVRGTETVEEVYERYARLDGRQVGDAGKVHYFLNRALGQHGEAGLSHGHYVLVVAENRQGVRGDGAGRNVEYGRQHLAGDFIHVGNHQQQTLRCGVGGGQRTGLQRAVHGAGGAALALHFLHHYSFAKDVFATCGSPFVNVFCHRRRGGDGVNGGHFREHVAHVGGCLVTVAGQEFLVLTHSYFRLILNFGV